MNPAELKRRARFETVRREVFAQVDSPHWRVLWYLPFNVLIVVMFAFEREWLRIAIQVGALALTILGDALHRREKAASVASLTFAGVSYFACLANTGTIASPLLPLGFPMIAVGVMLLPNQAAQIRFGAVMLVCTATVIALSRFSFTALPHPLVAADGRVSVCYAIVGAPALLFGIAIVIRLAIVMTRAYERIAFELAARREEVFEESEDHSRSFESVAARLAHEVKNPLAAIKGLSKHMARQSSDPKIAERLAIVAQEADRLQAVVDGFLSFSRGQGDLRIAQTKPLLIAKELVVLLETRAAEFGVTIEVSGDEEAALRADARKLRQALLNIVLNAMQASPTGGTVEVKTLMDESRVTITTIDHGTGMSPEVLDRIRKPYFTTREGGSGLGIAVARALVEQHGGTLHIKSQEGSGTTVTMDLPRAGPAIASFPVLPLAASTGD